jgi:copper transporter 1
MFAGSVIGVFFLVIAIEAVRRAGREYDRRLVQAAMAGLGGASISSAKSDTPPGEMARVSSGQQITR